MRIDILTIHKDILQGPFSQSIIKRAVEKKLVEICLTDIRDFSRDKHKRVDDYMFGGGAGMVMTIEPILNAIEKLKSERIYDEIIYVTPDAPVYTQQMANELSLLKNIIILCGHYKGIDQRLRDHVVTREISIGQYVLTGGELAAAIITDSIVRLIPGAISDETSALTDSYQDGLLAPPVYTRPADYKGWKAPEILLSGNERKIEEWRHEKAVEKTKKLRPGRFND